MARVVIFGSLRAFTDGVERMEISASNTRELLKKLSERHPALAEVIEAGVSLAIDGEVYKDAWFTPIGSNSEVVVMPLMVGG
ncbi:MAG: MoaD/ThiS family protein [Rhodobacteraceae bacterium]|nr:MoaD/ThiS family protein [Paracoccaceae bacterium]